VEFYANWCGACKRVGPMLNELAEEYGDRVYFYRVDIDKAGALTGPNKVDGVPTTIFYARGIEVKRIVGATWKNELQRELDSLLGA
jgi:thioredoxin 1